ncbi:unnamed protein product [Schistocephalus solidus]|uniref:NYD-SP28_assoc domain-containing protein n=1 Tax=Schistocephalus solidus TaxID=70667 RepID=A0A183TH25_SCHSO|nr:unnamed protein product [Schistocephalus solidus]
MKRLLKPMSESDQKLIRLDAVLNVLNVHNEEQLDKLFTYFLLPFDTQPKQPKKVNVSQTNTSSSSITRDTSQTKKSGTDTSDTVDGTSNSVSISRPPSSHSEPEEETAILTTNQNANQGSGAQSARSLEEEEEPEIRLIDPVDVSDALRRFATDFCAGKGPINKPMTPMRPDQAEGNEADGKKDQTKTSRPVRDDQLSEEDRQYWMKYVGNLVSEPKQKMWSALLTSLDRYRTLLKSRSKLIIDNEGLRSQNAELKHLLEEYLRSKHFLLMAGYSLVSFRDSAPDDPKVHAKYEYCTLCLKTRNVYVNRPERPKAFTGLLRRRVLTNDATCGTGSRKVRNGRNPIARVVKPIKVKDPRPSTRPPTGPPTRPSTRSSDITVDAKYPSEFSFSDISEVKTVKESQSRQSTWDAASPEAIYTTDQSNVDFVDLKKAVSGDPYQCHPSAGQESDLSHCYSVKASVLTPATATVVDSNARKSFYTFTLSSPWAPKEMLQTEQLKRRLQTEALRSIDNSTYSSTEDTITEASFGGVRAESVTNMVWDVQECRTDCYNAKAFGDNPFSSPPPHSRASSGFTSSLSDSDSIIGENKLCLKVNRQKVKRRKFMKTEAIVRTAHRSLGSCLVS